MNLNFKNLPVGDLPYEDIQLCKQMMLRLYEKIPFLPELPLMDARDEVCCRTLENMPCFYQKDGKWMISDNTDEKMMYTEMLYEKIIKSEPPYDLDMFSTEAPFFYMYIEILKRIKPQYTVINLTGPFTLANSMFNKNASTILLDKTYRKFICSTVIIKSLLFISKIKEASPETKPIIMFDEKMLFKYGTLKRTNESITKELVESLFEKVFLRLRKEGAIIGVQSFEKCNWQLIFDIDCVDIISFDAYQNPANLNMLASSVNRFLAKGGYINWGIIPVMNENVIRSLNQKEIIDRLKSTMELLSKEGVSMDLLLKRFTISIQGNLSKQPLIFAEKALMMANQISNKINF